MLKDNGRNGTICRSFKLHSLGATGNWPYMKSRSFRDLARVSSGLGEWPPGIRRSLCREVFILSVSNSTISCKLCEFSDGACIFGKNVVSITYMEIMHLTHSWHLVKSWHPHCVSNLRGSPACVCCMVWVYCIYLLVAIIMIINKH